MGADTSVGKKKHEWNPMADEEEWMAKHQDMEGEGKKRWTPTRAEAQDTRANPYSLETPLVRKWRDIGRQRAVGPGFIIIINLYVLCYRFVQGGSLLSLEFRGNRLTTQATTTIAWWILPNVALARMRLKSFNLTFPLPLPQYHTAQSCLSPLSQRGISHLQQEVRQRGRYWRSRLRVHRCGWREKAIYTSLTRKTSTIWLETLVLPSQMLSFRYPGSKRANHRSQKASPNIFQRLQSARWAVLLQQCGLSIQGYRYHL